MDIFERTEYAMKNYMRTHPDESTVYGLRGHFDMPTLPRPQYFRGGQWSDGDLTSRALDAWMFARMITGDSETGADIEAGQWKYFNSLINKDTGLVCVPEHSYPNRPGYYFHMWDQGRALKHLVNRYIRSYKTEGFDIRAMIDKLLSSVVALSEVRQLENGGTARYWPTDTFVDCKPIDRTLDYGPANFIDFTVVCAQLLDPVVKLYRFTRGREYLRLAQELANGFIGGFEKRRESTSPMFGADGAFYGHFHTCVSGLTGITELSKELYRDGLTARAAELAGLAARSYDWIFSEDNINRGSSCGWFPEGTGAEISENSELCCTADMIEFAASLAELSEYMPGFARLDRLWEDAERFTVNELFAMQILCPEKLRKYLKDPTPREAEDFDKLIGLYKGGWAASRVWLNEMLKVKNGGLQFYTIGCCLYSGQRGFYSYLRAMANDDGRRLAIRFGGSFRSAAAEIRELPSGGISLALSEDRRVEFRVPSYAKRGEVRVTCGGETVPCERAGNRLCFDGKNGGNYEILWENAEWVSVETVGSVNTGYVTDAETGKQIAFHIKYVGNKVTEIVPNGGAAVPFTEGL